PGIFLQDHQNELKPRLSVRNVRELLRKAPSNSCIFFKDKQNELKGPFTERKVQELYRQKFLEPSFPFYFVKDGETPCDDSPFITLEELCFYNGFGAPFCLPSEFAIKYDWLMQRLVSLLAEIRALREACFQWVSNLVDFYLRICNCYSQGIAPAINEGGELAIAIDRNLAKACKTSESMNILFNELVKRIEEKPYIYCAYCDFCMFTARQTFMHFQTPEHNSEIIECTDYHWISSRLITIAGAERVLEMTRDDVDEMLRRKKMIANRQGGLANLWKTPVFLPTVEFLTKTLPRKYANLFADTKNRRDILPLMRADNPVGQSLMKDVEEHIGNAKTRCIKCKLIFDNAIEYYDHLLSFLHLYETPFQSLDLITIVVNVQKKHLAPV
ncbi:hypothetical protein PMAYCL1PPCAC_00468, partial [Pristionchus mayeri]